MQARVLGRVDVIDAACEHGFNWPMGSAMSFTLMAVSLAVYLLLRTLFRRLVLP